VIALAAEMDWNFALTLFVALIISLTFHEAAHALFAKLGGDPTAYYGGQVTLNPLPHMQREPFGMVLLPVVSILLSGGQYAFGFAHAPYDPIWAFNNPRKAALMSAAGPLANILLAAIAFAVLWFLGRPESDAGDAVRTIALVFLMLNLLLAVFNLVPLPPLDGAGIVSGLVPAARGLYSALERVPMASLIVIIMMFNYFPRLFGPIYFEVRSWLPY
jgi:Zn-dependent protease